jgi:hypothetical protein
MLYHAVPFDSRLSFSRRGSPYVSSSHSTQLVRDIDSTFSPREPLLLRQSSNYAQNVNGNLRHNKVRPSSRNGAFYPITIEIENH